MDLSRVLAALDPSGPEAMLLCTAAALALTAVIGGGFVLLGQAERTARRGVTAAWSLAPRDLGLRALWRLNHAQSAAGRQSSASGTAPEPTQPAAVAVRGGAR